jgi:hypothetical protein
MTDLGCSSPSQGNAPCPFEYDEILKQVCAYFPRGESFFSVDKEGTVMHSMVRAIAWLLYDVNLRACELLNEFRCHTANETLDLWNADYGLPDECGINDLCAKVAATGGATCEYIEGLGELLGYDICCEEIEPAAQAGCFQVGCTRLPPASNFKYGGSELGFSCLGYCDPIPCGSPLGQAPLSSAECNIAGYSVSGCDEEEATSACAPVAECEVWSEPCTTPFISGCYKALEHDYVGNAYHYIVGFRDDDSSLLGTSASCEGGFRAGDAAICLGYDPLGTYNAGVAVPQPYSIAGCWDTGCTELCAPPVNEVMCFVQRYGPAHTVPVRRFCST